MKITLNNKAHTNIIVTLTGTNVINAVISKGEIKTTEIEGTPERIILIPEGKSDVTYLLAKFGVVLKRYFKITSEYTFTAKDNIEILLLTDKKAGSFRDEYERVMPMSEETEFSSLKYFVSDEQRMRKILENAINQADKSLKFFDLFDILGNALTALLILIVPFILIWIFGDINSAVKICSYAFAVLFVLVVLLNRFSDKVKRKLWKKTKGFALRKQIFKDYNSYFDSEYINSVFMR